MISKSNSEQHAEEHGAEPRAHNAKSFRSKRVMIGVAVAAFLVASVLISSWNRAVSVPATVMIGGLSQAEAVKTYGDIMKSLHRSHLEKLWNSVKHGDFKLAWNRLRRGPLEVKSMVRGKNGQVVVFVAKGTAFDLLYYTPPSATKSDKIQ